MFLCSFPVLEFNRLFLKLNHKKRIFANEKEKIWQNAMLKKTMTRPTKNIQRMGKWDSRKQNTLVTHISYINLFFYFPRDCPSCSILFVA